MTRFLFDSGIATDYIQRRHGVWDRARDEIARGNVIGIATPVLGEFVSGLSAVPPASAICRD